MDAEADHDGSGPGVGVRAVRDQLEIFIDGHLEAVIETSFAPAKGETINFRQVDFVVLSRTYTIDHIDEPRQRAAVCVINVTKKQ